MADFISTVQMVNQYCETEHAVNFSTYSKEFMNVSVQYDDNLDMVSVDCGMQTEDILLPQYCDIGVQLDRSIPGNISIDIGVQSNTVTKTSVGTSCRKSPSLKSKMVQATTKSTSQGINATVLQRSRDCQTERMGVRPIGKDAGVMCHQSPAAIDRYCQTFQAKMTNHGTGTKSIKCKSVGVSVSEREFDEPGMDSTIAADDDIVPGEFMDSGMDADWSQCFSSATEPEMPAQADHEFKFENVHDTLDKTFPEILDDLGVRVATSGEYPMLIQSEDRNRKVNFIIKQACSIVSDEGNRIYDRAFCLFDDLIIPICSSASDNPRTERYIKLFGNFGQYITNPPGSTYQLLEKGSRTFDYFQSIAMTELKSMLPDIQNRCIRPVWSIP
jgi:hypothetical protein